MRLIEGQSRTKSGMTLHHFTPSAEEAGSKERDVYGVWLVHDGETRINERGHPFGTYLPMYMAAMLEWEGDAADGAAREPREDRSDGGQHERSDREERRRVADAGG